MTRWRAVPCVASLGASSRCGLAPWGVGPRRMAGCFLHAARLPRCSENPRIVARDVLRKSPEYPPLLLVRLGLCRVLLVVCCSFVVRRRCRAVLPRCLLRSGSSWTVAVSESVCEREGKHARARVALVRPDTQRSPTTSTSCCRGTAKTASSSPAASPPWSSSAPHGSVPSPSASGARRRQGGERPSIACRVHGRRAVGDVIVVLASSQPLPSSPLVLWSSAVVLRLTSCRLVVVAPSSLSHCLYVVESTTRHCAVFV